MAAWSYAQFDDVISPHVFPFVSFAFRLIYFGRVSRSRTVGGWTAFKRSL